MIQISNQDAHDIQVLLERGHYFYRNHALKTCHINDGRRMAVMAKKLRRKINRVNHDAAPAASPKNKRQ